MRFLHGQFGKKKNPYATLHHWRHLSSANLFLIERSYRKMSGSPKSVLSSRIAVMLGAEAGESIAQYVSETFRVSHMHITLWMDIAWYMNCLPLNRETSYERSNDESFSTMLHLSHQYAQTHLTSALFLLLHWENKSLSLHFLCLWFCFSFSFSFCFFSFSLQNQGDENALRIQVTFLRNN